MRFYSIICYFLSNSSLNLSISYSLFSLADFNFYSCYYLFSSASKALIYLYCSMA